MNTIQQAADFRFQGLTPAQLAEAVDFAEERGWRPSGSSLRRSECGHPQRQPTDVEIDGCPDVIARECPVCDAPIWWNVDRWRRL